MTLPASSYRDPLQVADENIEKEKLNAAYIEKQAERYRLYKSRKHKAQVKKAMKNGGMR